MLHLLLVNYTSRLNGENSMNISIHTQRVKGKTMSIVLTVIAVLLSVQLSLATAASVCKTSSITATTPTHDFINNGDGTITHRKTGLMWTQCSEGYTTTTTPCDTFIGPNIIGWNNALSRAESSNFANYTDWRLPNIKELMSIVERQCHSPAINEAIFLGSTRSFHWTSTPSYGRFGATVGSAWMVDFDTGNDSLETLDKIGAVRLVRGGR